MCLVKKNFETTTIHIIVENFVIFVTSTSCKTNEPESSLSIIQLVNALYGKSK